MSKPNEFAGEKPLATFAMCFRKVNKELNIKKLFRNLMANVATHSWGSALNETLPLVRRLYQVQNHVK